MLSVNSRVGRHHVKTPEQFVEHVEKERRVLNNVYIADIFSSRQIYVIQIYVSENIGLVNYELNVLKVKNKNT